MTKIYHPHIRLDDGDQLLEVYTRTPSQSQTKEWGLCYWGRDELRVVLSEECYPGLKQEDLVFPSEMLDYYPNLRLEIDGKDCFIWGKRIEIIQGIIEG